MSEIAEFTRHLGHYLPPNDIALVERAFDYSEAAHRGQFRKSGEPYITHPLAVASILSQWRLDAHGLAAALLHDVMEDTKVSKSEIETTFGKPVADIEEGHISTASCILANMSMKLGRSLTWDAEKRQVVRDDEANRLLRGGLGELVGVALVGAAGRACRSDNANVAMRHRWHAAPKPIKQRRR